MGRTGLRLLPRIHLPALLQEVDDWTGFSRVFTHLYNGQPPHDRYGLLSVIIGQAVNLGISAMAEATQGYSAQRLTWINDWYVREQCYHRALAEIVRMQIQVPLSARWGSGRTSSSSDGQRRVS